MIKTQNRYYPNDANLGRKLRTILSALVLLTLLAACNLPDYPKPPNPSFVPSNNDANAFEQTFQNAINQATQKGNFSVILNEQQVSAWLALRAPDYARQAGYEWPLKNVQAKLENGTILIFAVVTQQGVPETNAQVIFKPGIDANGKLTVSVVSGNFGIISAPADTMKNLNGTIQNLLLRELGQISNRYRLTQLIIVSGTLKITGQITP